MATVSKKLTVGSPRRPARLPACLAASGTDLGGQRRGVQCQVDDGRDGCRISPHHRQLRDGSSSCAEAPHIVLHSWDELCCVGL